MRKNQEQAVLYIVSTPIGNEDDISLRALKVLKKVDTVICEEEKVGALLAKRHNFSANLEQLNEHNEDEYAPQLIERLQNGETFALISDAGTPIFADPGRYFLNLALDANINIVVVPGPSSLMTALVRSGFTSDVFTCAGFLSRTTEDRLMELQALALEPRTTVLLETPYRLKPLLEAAAKVMPDRKAYIGCNLTMAFEHHHYGTFSELHQVFTDTPFKGEFVIVFEGHPGRTVLSVLSNFEKKKERIATSDSKKIKMVEETHDEIFESDEDSLPIKHDIETHDIDSDSQIDSAEDSGEFNNNDSESGGFQKREDVSGGYQKREGDSGGFRKREGDSGGFRKREGDSGGFRKREGDSGGFRKREGDSGGFRKREGDSGGFRKREGDSGGFRKREGDSGGFRKREGDSGGFRKREGDSGGFKKREGDSFSERSGSRDRKFGGKPSFDSKDKKKYKGKSDTSSGMRPPRKRY